jgi:hypothetical protein
LNGILEIFLVALRGERRSFWLLALKGDREYGELWSRRARSFVGVVYLNRFLPAKGESILRSSH